VRLTSACSASTLTTSLAASCCASGPVSGSPILSSYSMARGSKEPTLYPALIIRSNRVCFSSPLAGGAGREPRDSTASTLTGVGEDQPQQRQEHPLRRRN